MAQIVTSQVVNALRQRRVRRDPSHSFYIKSRPWAVVPFMIAPVLPGETLKNMSYQARVVSDPIKNPLMGWWTEHYFFYVKLRDLYKRDTLTQMLLNPQADLSSLDGATSVPHYHFNGAGSPAINWPLLCTESIVDNYFRNEGEVASDYMIGSYYGAQVGITNALDSAIAASVATDDAINQDLTSTTPGEGDGTAKVWTSEIDKAMREYLFALQNKLTDMTFEDWCEQFGISMPKEDLFKPELIRYSREWTYPTNTIDPVSGAPSSAVSWSVSGRADKDRFFREPGFIVGVSVTRPKVYFKNLRSHMTGLMNNPYAWLPPPLMTDPNASFIEVGAGDGPANQSSSAYRLDIKDLLLYGDQFLNFDLAADGDPDPLPEDVANMVALPNAGMTNVRYPASTDGDKVFVDDEAGKGHIRQDGVCSLHILGRQVDTSPNSVGTNKTV